MGDPWSDGTGKANSHGVTSGVYKTWIDTFQYTLKKSSKMAHNFPKILNINQLFHKLNRFIYN